MYDHNHQLDAIIKITNFNSQVCFYQDAWENESNQARLPKKECTQNDANCPVTGENRAC